MIDLLTLLIVIVVLFVLLPIVIYFSIRNRINGKEGFFGYHPHHPSWPWYWYNFPTRMYVPTRNMVVDMRGDPRCPNFGQCGEAVRSGKVLVHPERHPVNYLWGIPTTSPHFFYYDYWHSSPRFDYLFNAI